MVTYYQVRLDSNDGAESWRSLFDNGSPGNRDSALFEKRINPLNK